jgi:GNAT superfamily N-acetyltransferase
MPGTPYPFANLALSLRLEGAEAQSNIDFVEARARAFPESKARHIEVAGAHAMFDGVDSPLTQTFGLGLVEPVSKSGLERLEAFFLDLGAPVFHEVSPLADPSAVALLNERGYEPFEFTSVMFQPIALDRPQPLGVSPGLRVRAIGPDEVEQWAATSARGWAETPEVGDFMLSFGRVSARKTSGFSFLAELDGEQVAAGGLTLHDRVALLAGASTIPEARRKGAQNALLDARLRFAALRGCDIAMMCALPGSASQRNAERHGFRIAYTRIKWRLKARPV